MLVELGNAAAIDRVPDGSHRLPLEGHRVTYISIPDGNDEAGNPLYSFPDEHSDELFHEELVTSLSALAEGPGRASARRVFIENWFSHPSGVRGLPDHAAATTVVHPTRGAWQEVSADSTPTWVWSDNKEFEKFLAEYYDCPAGRPDALEDTHWTQYGHTVYPPGAAPAPDAVALHTNIGRDQQATQQFGFGYLGTVGTATATTASSLTGSAETGVSHATNDCAGQTIYAGPNGSGVGSTAYMLVKTNTSGTTPVYSGDRWYAPAAPGGAAATTPDAASHYQIINGGQPTQFVGLTADTTPPAAGDTVLPSEIITASGGLIRKIAPITHTAGAATVVLTPVFTANASDTLPVTIAKAGASQSITSGVSNSYQTLVSPSAVIGSIGDQLTLTWTYTMT